MTCAGDDGRVEQRHARGARPQGALVLLGDGADALLDVEPAKQRSGCGRGGFLGCRCRGRKDAVGGHRCRRGRGIARRLLRQARVLDHAFTNSALPLSR